MDMNNVNIEEIVKQVLSGMTGTAPAAAVDPWYHLPDRGSNLQRQKDWYDC